MKICQCWDDGVVDDIRLCDILRKHGAKASFNLNPALHHETRGEDWTFKEVKTVQRMSLDELKGGVYDGFTIANHTMSHPFPTKISDDELTHEINEGRRLLQDWFDQEVLGFAYPFGDHDDRVCQAVADAGHIYARTCKNVERPFPCDDAMRLPTQCHFLNDQFWDKFETARSADDVFYFWGHSYELISEADWQQFDDQIAKISACSDAEWVDLPALFQ